MPWSVTILTALAAILVLDFAVFVARRLRTLRAWERGCPRLVSPAKKWALPSRLSTSARWQRSSTWSTILV